jgi:hypothetical protein
VEYANGRGSPVLHAAAAIPSRERQSRARVRSVHGEIDMEVSPAVPPSAAPSAAPSAIPPAATLHSPATAPAAGTSAPPARAKPLSAPAKDAPAAPEDKKTHGLLRGASTAELNRLYDTYAVRRQRDHWMEVPTLANDTRNARKIADALPQALTGYPEEVVTFEQRHADRMDQLAALPPRESQFFASSAATFHSAYRLATPDGRDAIDTQVGKLESAVLGQYNHHANDPLERVLSVFNTPVGAGYLDKDGQYRVHVLAGMRRRFMMAASPEQRERIFKSALTQKKELQSQISAAIDVHDTKQAATWKEANDDVDRMIGEADQFKGDPGKRYELIARQLHTSNPGSGEDPFEERRILAFTQRMQDDPALRDKLSRWEIEAGRKLNSFGVGGPPPYAEIANHLPAAGPDYVRDLADRYDALLGDSSTKNRSITPQERAKKLAGQIVEGTARVLLGMTPFAPLTMVLDQHSMLAPGVRLGIDLTAGLIGAAIDPANAVSEAMTEAKVFAQAVKEIDTAAQFGGEASHAFTYSEPATLDHTGNLAPPTASDIGMRQRVGGHSIAIPEDLAAAVHPDTLAELPGSNGLLIDDGTPPQTYARIDGRVYPVRYDSADETWRVYDRSNAWRPTYPVRPRSGNNWEVHDDAGLKRQLANAQPTSSAAGMSPELRTALDAENWTSDTNRSLDDNTFRRAYSDAFRKLSPDQKKAVAGWTALDIEEEDALHGKNFELNRALYTHTAYPGMEKDVKDLLGALDRLPAPAAQGSHLLRVADVGPAYAGQFKVGDLVTNSPAFMSASSTHDYALGAIADDGAVAASKETAIAFYDIHAQTAKPLLDSVASEASNEVEWLFRPNTVFRVDEIGVMPGPTGEFKPRIGMRLTEIPVTATIDAKNIHTGETVQVSPRGPSAGEIVAGPSPAKRPRTDPPRPG